MKRVKLAPKKFVFIPQELADKAKNIIKTLKISPKTLNKKTKVK